VKIPWHRIVKFSLVTSSGPPTLVLLPGMHGTATLFDPLRGRLSPSIRVLAVEYPTDATLDYAALTERVRRTLPAGDLVLLGESFSGPMAVALAASEPAARGLVLASSFLRVPVPPLLRPAVRRLGPAVIARGLPAWAIERYLIGPGVAPTLVASVVSEVRRVPPAVLAARLQTLLDVDVRATFRAGRLPTLLIAGGRDRLLPPSALREAARLRPDAAMLHLHDAPHLALQTQPETVAKSLESFLAGS
jgi:pimeloyl-ACP methyl ester carboxylesterase